jgi:hypothetical protein
LPPQDLSSRVLQSKARRDSAKRREASYEQTTFLLYCGYDT